MSTSGLDGSFNLQDLVKKVLLAFCEVHVSFTHRLDIYGSIHVRSDDSDLTCFVLNEHSYKQTDSRKKESDSGLTRYVSSVSGNSPIETVFHKNSNLSGQVLPSTPNRNSSSQAAEASAAALLCEQDNGRGNHRSLSATPTRVGKTTGKATGRATEKVETRSAKQHPRSGAGDQVSDTDEPISDVHQSLSVAPDVRPQDASTEAEPWPESTFDPSDEQNPSHYDQKMSYIKNEEPNEERDSQATIKLEPANENEIIELESDEDGYDDQANQSMFAYAQSDYDQSGLYPGYPSSSAPNSDTYSQVTWMQSSTSSFHSPNDPEAAFSAMNSINKPPPQKICSFCLKCFTTTVQLRMHVQRYHSTTPAIEGGANANWRRRQGTPGTAASSPGTPGADKRLTCSICLLSFRSLDGLRCHENSKHSRNKVYNCQYCSQVFLTRQAAYTHRTKFHRMKKNESPAA